MWRTCTTGFWLETQAVGRPARYLPVCRGERPDAATPWPDEANPVPQNQRRSNERADSLDPPAAKDLRHRRRCAEIRRPRHPTRRDFRAAWPERRRQDDADQHRLRDRHPDRAAKSWSTARTGSRISAMPASRIGLVPQELTTEAFEPVQNTVTFSRGLYGKPRNDAFTEELLKRLSLWDKRKTEDALSLGRHEAAGDDRQGAQPRARDPVPRRADRGRRCRASPRHVGRR